MESLSYNLTLDDFAGGSITVQETAVLLNRWRAVFWKCERYLRRIVWVFFNVFIIFLWYLLSYVVNRSTSALHLFELFCCERFFPTSKAYKHLPYSNYININNKGLTWYGFKTVFYTTFMYLCRWYHVIL